MDGAVQQAPHPERQLGGCVKTSMNDEHSVIFTEWRHARRPRGVGV